MTDPTPGRDSADPHPSAGAAVPGTPAASTPATGTPATSPSTAGTSAPSAHALTTGGSNARGGEFFRAIELPGAGAHPAAWRRADSRAEELFSARYWLDAITAAERAGLDAVLVPDSFDAGSGGQSAVRGRLDAVAIVARAAALTERIGLIPQVTTTHTEPFHVSKAIQALDYATLGRAGWEVAVSVGAAQAKAFGRKGPQDAASLWAEAEEAIEVVTRLWDSWEDDAEIREVATGRFIDRDKLHYIDFAGEYFSVKGPSITPRSPQGQPVVVIRADGGSDDDVAVRRADLIRIAAPDLDTARAGRTALRAAAAVAGRDPDTVTVLLDLDIHLAETEEDARAEVDRLDSWATELGLDVEGAATASDLGGSATAGQGAFPRLRHLGTAGSLREFLRTLADSGAADGVVLRPLAVPSATRLLAGVTGDDDLVFRTPGAAPTRTGTRAHLPPPDERADLTGTAPTLRARLGLPRPASRYAVRTEGVPS